MLKIRRHRRAIGGGVGISLLVFGAPLVGTATAAHVGCGTVITANTTLDSDIGPCPGDGIIVGADNISLNLNGQKVTGNFDEGAGGEFVGIRLPQRTGVTVFGNRGRTAEGGVSGFEAGVLVNGGSGNNIGNLVVEDNVGPPTGTPELGDGIILFNSADNRIVSNVLSRNGYYDGIGALGVGSDRNVIQNNVVEETLVIGDFQLSGVGITTNPVIEGFTDGAQVFDNRIIRNHVRDNGGQGISTSSSYRSRIIGNLVEGNGGDSLPGNGIGVRVNFLAPRATTSLVADNIVRGNRQGMDIRSAGNQILNNEVSDSLDDGILVIDFTRDNLFAGNDVNNNGHGILDLGFSPFPGGTNTYTGNRITGNIANELGNETGNDIGTGLAVFGSSRRVNISENEVHGNGAGGIVLGGVTNSQIRNNNAADNVVAPSSPVPANAYDLFDSNLDCDANVWSENTWGSGGYFPECVAAGGSGPSPAAAASETIDPGQPDLARFQDVEPPARRSPSS